MLISKTFRQAVLQALVIAGLSLSACGQAQVVETPSPTIPAAITPYLTRTPDSEISPAPLPARSPTPLQTPTPTPMSHRVIQGETMLGIALRYGISLEELMAANPEVDPRFLSIDTELVIPLGESSPPPFVMPTPVPVNLGELACYPTGEGGAWCFWLLDNERSRPLENLSARIILYSNDGEILGEEVAIPPLNLIPAEGSLPLVAYFPPPLPEEIHPQGEIVTALLARRNDERYLNVKLQVDDVDLHPSGLQATVNGNVSLPRNSAPASLVWLAAVAFGEGGRVVGVRKWEAEVPPAGLATVTPEGATTSPTAIPTGQTPSPIPTGETSPGRVDGPTGSGPILLLEKPLEGGESLPFEIDVYSLGPVIQEVEVLVEARP